MSLLIYDDVFTNSIATQLSAICAGAPISITPTGNAHERLVTYPSSQDPSQQNKPPISHKMVYAIANSLTRVEVWPIVWDGGLPTTVSGTRLIEESDAALVNFDQFPNPQNVSVSYYANPHSFYGPHFTVKVIRVLGTSREPVMLAEDPHMMLVHLLAHIYLLVSGQYDPANPEVPACELENIYRTEHYLPTRVDSHVQRSTDTVVFDLGGCG